VSPREPPSEPLIFIGVKVPESLLLAVDRLAEQQGITRSDAVRDALRKFTISAR
jgi:metal-responsive CopG/Arc/MetJ family transcriptional regulator